MNAIVLMSATEAQRLTQRIKLIASGVRDGLFKLRNLVDEAKGSNAWQVLGFPSWTAYLADTLGEEPMRLGREERQELVAYLAGEGMSTRAIAPIVGASQKTVDRDVRESFDSPAPVRNLTPEPVRSDGPEHAGYPALVQTATPKSGPVETIRFDTQTGEVIEDDPEPTTVTGLDGKTYTRPAPKPERRKSLVDDAYDVERSLFKQLERLREITRDDRFNKNKASIQDVLRPIADLAHEILADLFDNQSQED